MQVLRKFGGGVSNGRVLGVAAVVVGSSFAASLGAYLGAYLGIVRAPVAAAQLADQAREAAGQDAAIGAAVEAVLGIQADAWNRGDASRRSSRTIGRATI
jgi:hypothetical protein